MRWSDLSFDQKAEVLRRNMKAGVSCRAVAKSLWTSGGAVQAFARRYLGGWQSGNPCSAYAIKYPRAVIEVGGEFTLDTASSKRAACMAYDAARVYGRKFSVRTRPDGIYVTRVA